jgi:NADPH:quinone reductase-like Zn-dependent oxidoreductase
MAETIYRFKSMMEANIDATRPVVDKVFPFVEAKAAFAHMEAQGYVGKVVIKI